jgi:hypothetical protein
MQPFLLRTTEADGNRACSCINTDCRTMQISTQLRNLIALMAQCLPFYSLAVPDHSFKLLFSLTIPSDYIACVSLQLSGL